jgi:hypothetical protein
MGDERCRYRVYGLSLRSDVPLALSIDPHGDVADIDIQSAPARFFSDALAGARFEPNLPRWYRYARLADRSSYLRWQRLGEFLVSPDGRSLKCRCFEGASSESFQVYLVQRALSFALVKQGFEPLHATAVVVGGQAIAFLGDGGSGKSSLAASFLAAGDTLLTDDLLLLRTTPQGICASPGPPRLKLFPRTARRLLGDAGTGVPMNPDTKKLVMPLATRHTWNAPVPLKALYVLQSRGHTSRRIDIEPLVPRAAFVEILRSTFNYLHTDADRVQRLFVDASRLALEVPIKRLRYPRALDKLPAVREALLADAGSGAEHGRLIG